MTLSRGTVDKALSDLGHYRVTAAQHVALEGPPDDISGALLLSLGLRESLLKNINNKKKTDKGWCQLTSTYHAPFLRSQPGCLEGTWVAVPGHTALEPDYCPRFTPALNYALKMLQDHRAYALQKTTLRGQDAVRYAVAAYNAGGGGAWSGYKMGDLDAKTTGGDYSAWVLEHRTLVLRWLNEHPNWKITSL